MSSVGEQVLKAVPAFELRASAVGGLAALGDAGGLGTREISCDTIERYLADPDNTPPDDVSATAPNRADSFTRDLTGRACACRVLG